MNRFWSPKLGDVTEPITTWNPVREAREAFRYIELSAVDQDMKVITDAAHVESTDAPSRARQILRTDDILVSTVRPNLNAVARVTQEFDGATASTGFCVLRPTPGKVDAAYLFHWVRTPRFIDDMVRNASGASYPAVSDRIVKASVFPLPPLYEQRRIAAILDKADALRQKRKRAIALLDSLTQSIFLEMFGDLSERRWPKRRLGDIVTIRRGASPRPIEQFLGGTIPWIKIGDASAPGDFYLRSTAEKVTEKGKDRSVFVAKGSVIFANCGVSLGFARILDIDGCIHDGWLVFEAFDPEVLDKIFLICALNSYTARFRTMAPSGTQPNLNTGIMKNFEMIVPPIEMQAAFSQTVLRIGAQQTAAYRLLGEQDALFTSLQHRAFSGQL